MRASMTRGVAVWMGLLVCAASAMAAAAGATLIDVVCQQDAQALRALLKQPRVDVNAPQADGTTALMWAAHAGDVEKVDLLIQAGAKVNAANDYGVTPLGLACENASLPLAERLLAAGANVNAAEKNGKTPLMIA